MPRLSWYRPLAVAMATTLWCTSPVAAAPACLEQTGAPVVVRSSRDTRIMKSHPNANDGAAGLVWLKRGSHVRGLVGFDLSCQAEATPDLDCASIEVSIYEGSPRVGGSFFSAHRLLVPFLEGTQAFNEFSFASEKLGSFPGSGPGTTWDCRVDPDVSDNTSSGCAPSDKWAGTDDCGGGVPCYDPNAATAVYEDDSQETLSWEVTGDVVGAVGDASWLLKVRDETVKSGAVKFFTKEGAQFMAELESLVGDATHFDAAPRLLLWGAGVLVPTAELIAPVGEAENPASVRIRQAGPSVGGTARWQNTTTGAWGWMVADGDSDWTASIPLAAGENEIDFRFFDGCGTEGRLRSTLTHGVAEPCGGAEDCSQAYLCYRARPSTRAERPDRIVGADLPDVLDTALVDVRKLSNICVPANIDGDGVASPELHGVGYEAKASSGQPPYTQQSGLVLTDRFGTSELSTLRVDGIIAPASLGFGTNAPLPAGDVSPYKCHRVVASRATTLASRLTVQVSDVLEDREYRVRYATRVCYPTGDPAPPLICYRVSRGFGQPKHENVRKTLRATDLFGTVGIDTRREDELCVPATPPE